MPVQSESLGSEIRAALMPKGSLPSNIYRFVIATSGIHQLALVTLTIAVFLIEIVPLELQRRIVNGIVKHRKTACPCRGSGSLAAPLRVRPG